MQFEIPPTPDRVTLDLLSGTSDDLIESVLLNYVLALTGAHPDRELEVLPQLPAGLRAHYLAFLVDIEVLNGGFNQYFFNSSGIHGPATPAAYEYLNMTEAAAIMRKALLIYAEREGTLDDARDEGTVEAFVETYEDDPFVGVDDRYNELEEELREARVQFIRSHPEDFIHP